MRPEHTEAGIARLPGFLDFIAATIGAEARRVAEHCKETSYVVSAFLDDIPNLLSGDRIPRRIDFRWWNSDGRLGAAQIFKLTHPAGKYLPLHGDDGDYEADCPIPDKRDLEFEIAVLFRDDGGGVGEGARKPVDAEQPTRPGLGRQCTGVPRTTFYSEASR